MAAPPVRAVATLEQFTKEIEDALKASRNVFHDMPGAPEKIVNWYRGVGMATTHKLTPSLYRHPNKTEPDDLLILEKRMLDWFRRRAVLYHSLASIAEGRADHFEYLFFMQHNRVPTRLLDWTENPYIALYFALTSAPSPAVEDAAVWVLSPTAWNQKSLGEQWGPRGPLALEDQEVSGYAPRVSIEIPQLRAMRDESVAMYGISNSQRMVAQRGVFTIFGRSTDPMEQMYDGNGYPEHSLIKIVIPPEATEELLDTVVSCGFTDSVAYPDLEGLAMEIKRMFDFNV